MENNSEFDMEAVYFDDDVLFHETVMECVMRENEEKFRSKEWGSSLPEVITEDAFRLLIETTGGE